MTENLDLYNKTYEYIFQEEFPALAFLVGLSIKHNLLSDRLKTRWLRFIRDDMAMMFIGDLKTKFEYDELYKSLEEIVDFVMRIRGRELNEVMIEEAEKKNPKEGWITEISFDTWRARMKSEAWGS